MAPKPYRANMSFSIPGVGPWRYDEVRSIDPDDPAWEGSIRDGLIVPVDGTSYDEPDGAGDRSAQGEGDSAA